MVGGKELDERKSVILKFVVRDYVSTAQPVGSQHLAERYTLGVKPATIRNELAEMSEMGYLRQPHTSAGRIPSDLGYRFYVDRLMEPVTLSRNQAAQTRKWSSESSEVEEIIYDSCRILAGLTRYTSLATRPSTNETTVRLVSLSRLPRHKLLLVLVLSTGVVEHRILDVKHQMTEAETVRLSNLLTSQVAGRTLQEVGSTQFATPESGEALETYKLAISSISDMARSAADDEVFIEGTSNMLKQPEFQDFERLERLLKMLDKREALLRLLSMVMLGRDVSVVIGSENPYPDMRDASFVAARYFISDRVCGTIGVIGPTRMDYGRASAAVTLMARSLSDFLTAMSVG